MNTAPLQLLPVDYGNDHQKKVSRQMKPEEFGKSFNDVLESAAKKNETRPSFDKRQTDGATNSRDQNAKTEMTKGGQVSGTADENIQAEAGKTGDRKVDAGTRSEKNEKSGKRSYRKTGKIASETEIPEGKGDDGLAAIFAGRADKVRTEESKLPKTGKEAVKSVSEKNILKFDSAGIIGSDADLSKAVMSDSGFEKIGGKEKKNEKASAKVSRDGGKLSSESAEKLFKAAAGGKGEGIKAAANGSINKDSNLYGTKTSVPSGRDGKSGSKLRVSDHRKTSSAHQEGNTFKINSDDNFKLAGTSSDDSGKTIELNASPDSGKIEGRSAQPRIIQSNVLSQLKEGVNDQIVKQAGIIVKADGNGEIKLVMKPEQLGKVRIQLSLNDNHIAGRIIVENNIVREIFESNLENLYKAFGSEGFENGGLEVLVEGGDSDGSGKRSSGGMNKRAVQAIEDSVPEIAETEWQNNAVNMVV